MEKSTLLEKSYRYTGNFACRKIRRATPRPSQKKREVLSKKRSVVGGARMCADHVKGSHQDENLRTKMIRINKRIEKRGGRPWDRSVVYQKAQERREKK